jgi:hypothetical protein
MMTDPSADTFLPTAMIVQGKAFNEVNSKTAMGMNFNTEWNIFFISLSNFD